jgi:hypothetical protein
LVPGTIRPVAHAHHFFQEDAAPQLAAIVTEAIVDRLD